MEALINRIKEYRERMNMSQYELAEALGVSQKAVSAWEVGRTSPRMQFANEMCRLFNCSLSDLFQKKSASAVFFDNEETKDLTPQLRTEYALETEEFSNLLIELGSLSPDLREVCYNRLLATVKKFRELDNNM